MFSKYVRLFLNRKQFFNSEQQNRIFEIGQAVFVFVCSLTGLDMAEGAHWLKPLP